MDLQLAGKRAAVAASSVGLGFGCAQALLEEGADVVISGRQADRLEAAAKALPGALPVRADVSTPEGAVAFVEDARAALGGIDILVANAGGPPAGTFATTGHAAYPDALGLNLLSTVAMCDVAIPEMQARGWGRVVGITSVSVRVPLPNLILSNTARAGATAFLKTVATEVAPDGVTVNSVQPGLHDTERLRSLGDAVARSEAIPARRLGDPADFGKIVAFLCSDAAKFITGAAIPVDGGASPGLQ